MSNEEQLKELAKNVSDSRSYELFIEFLEKFKEVEAEHIQSLLTKNDLRSANLCAEAYGTIELIIQTLSGDSDDL